MSTKCTAEHTTPYLPSTNTPAGMGDKLLQDLLRRLRHAGAGYFEKEKNSVTEQTAANCDATSVASHERPFTTHRTFPTSSEIATSTYINALGGNSKRR